ncbi:MAG: hypothetical protein ACI8Q1_001217 [Parvicella sp.]|jgi:hypothetical protein
MELYFGITYIVRYLKLLTIEPSSLTKYLTHFQPHILCFDFLDDSTLLVHATSLYKVNLSNKNQKIEVLVSQCEHHQTITKPRRTKDGNIILQFWVDSVGHINQSGIEVKPINLITSSCKDFVSILDFSMKHPTLKSFLSRYTINILSKILNYLQ